MARPRGVPSEWRSLGRCPGAVLASVAIADGAVAGTPAAAPVPAGPHTAPRMITRRIDGPPCRSGDSTAYSWTPAPARAGELSVELPPRYLPTADLDR